MRWCCFLISLDCSQFEVAAAGIRFSQSSSVRIAAATCLQIMAHPLTRLCTARYYRGNGPNATCATTIFSNFPINGFCSPEIMVLLKVGTTTEGRRRLWLRRLSAIKRMCLFFANNPGNAEWHIISNQPHIKFKWLRLLHSNILYFAGKLVLFDLIFKSLIVKIIGKCRFVVSRLGNLWKGLIVF